MSNDDNDVLSTSLGMIRDESPSNDTTFLANIPERVFGVDDAEASEAAPAPLDDVIVDSTTAVVDEKPQIELDAQQQVMVSRWISYANRQPATPVEEHELLTAVSTDVALRDYLIVSVLHDWLSDRIDNVPSTFSGSTPLEEALEETLGRCANDSPEKSACQVMLFTARLAEQMPRSGQDFMKALSWMSEDDVAMLVEAGSFASPELSEYINVLVQSVAVTKVTR